MREDSAKDYRQHREERQKIRSEQARQDRRAARWLRMRVRIAVGLVFVLILIVFTVFAQVRPFSSDDQTIDKTTVVTENDRHVIGSLSNPVSLVEYSDFECPACRAYHETVATILESYGESIRFSYRHFPLMTIHRNALPAALASEAAGMQGAFWEMYNRLFEEQPVWSRLTEEEALKLFRSFAFDLNLDMERFDADMESDEARRAVMNDVASGRRLQITATPTFFLNGERIELRGGVDLVEAVGRAVREARADSMLGTATETVESRTDGKATETSPFGDDPYARYVNEIKERGDATGTPATSVSEGTRTAPETVQRKPVVYVLRIYSSSFDPRTIEVPLGTPVQLRLISKDGFHDFVLPDYGVRSDTVAAGHETVVEFLADKQGEFPFYSSVGDDRHLGLTGTLVVR